MSAAVHLWVAGLAVAAAATVAAWDLCGWWTALMVDS